jgi:hypothetical protein
MWEKVVGELLPRHANYVSITGDSDPSHDSGDGLGWNSPSPLMASIPETLNKEE